MVLSVVGMPGCTTYYLYNLVGIIYPVRVLVFLSTKWEYYCISQDIVVKVHERASLQIWCNVLSREGMQKTVEVMN